MGSTSKGIRFPEGTDPPLGPAQMQTLSQDVDKLLPVYSPAAPASPVTNAIWVDSKAVARMWDGTQWRILNPAQWSAATAGPIAGTYDAAKPIVPVVYRALASSGPSGLLLLNLPAGVTAVLAADATVDISSGQGFYAPLLAVNTSLTQAVWQLHDFNGLKLNTVASWHGTVWVQF